MLSFLLAYLAKVFDRFPHEPSNHGGLDTLEKKMIYYPFDPNDPSDEATQYFEARRRANRLRRLRRKAHKAKKVAKKESQLFPDFPFFPLDSVDRGEGEEEKPSDEVLLEEHLEKEHITTGI